jgi:hypothetical protein
LHHIVVKWKSAEASQQYTAPVFKLEEQPSKKAPRASRGHSSHIPEYGTVHSTAAIASHPTDSVTLVAAERMYMQRKKFSKEMKQEGGLREQRHEERQN